jgi:soluble cytochrome b562
LELNDPKTAFSILQTVSGKLDIILAKDPSLALVPADVETDIFDFKGDTKTIEQEIKKADKLLDAGKIQDARQILNAEALLTKASELEYKQDLSTECVNDFETPSCFI